MNALTRATATTLPRVAAQRRMQSTRQVVDAINNKPVWLNDISTYPVIAICAGACIGCAGYMAYKFQHPDVRVDKNKRGSEIRWWGTIN